MLNCFEELRLDDLLDDPLTGIVMSGDGVKRDDILRLMTRIAASRLERQDEGRAE